MCIGVKGERAAILVTLHPCIHCQNLVSVFSIGKVIHLPTQQKGRMVVFKDHEHLAEVLRVCLAQGAPRKAVCCLPQLKTCGKAATESTDSVSQKRLAKHGLQSLCTFGMAVAG